MKLSSFAAASTLALALFTPSAMADGRNPGSVLIYPVHHAGNPDGGKSLFTIICVTNSNLDPVPFDKSTLVHYQYVNVIPGQYKFKPYGCTIFDRIETLTPGDILCVLTSCHNAYSPKEQEGYLVVSAQDPDKFNTPWSFNHLMGSELVINGSGVMYSLNAIPFESPMNQGAPTDKNGNGNLDFDGVEYEGVPDVLYIDAFVASQGSQLALLNLTGTDKDLNTVQFLVWNDNEFPLSTTLVFNCWFDCPLKKVSTLFTEYFLKNNTPHDPDELDIDCQWGDETIETGWAIIDSIDVRTQGGTSISDDGALLGCITAGDRTRFDGGRLLWESAEKQTNGSAFAP